jgi:hypothetical protein
MAIIKEQYLGFINFEPHLNMKVEDLASLRVH